ncbi:Tubulin-specific chaperone C [Grifola frondosa]|uniref:Tubulin-specific chaperone C n=1 Tax=Grifola frondosa TaxID=5627 RepID=A0A1C7MII9_GRIFR|nr:Tubulin-specific chaperone C [Grifola frondosa]
MSSTNQALIQEFNTHFQTVRSELTGRLDNLSAGVASSDALKQLSVEVAKLRKELTDGTTFLPSFDQRQCELRLKEIETSLETARASTAPKSKFAFKRKANKLNPSTPPAPEKNTPAMSTAITTSSSQSNTPSSSNSITLSGHSHSYLSMSSLPRLLSSSSDLTIADLDYCIVNLLPPDIIEGDDTTSPRKFAITALHVRNLTNTILMLPKIEGSALLHDMKRCIIALGCHQYRMHASSEVDVYLSISSNPIIEHCFDIRFGDYPTIFQSPCQSRPLSTSKFLSVQDFSHIRPTPSPNWSPLTANQSISDANWPKAPTLIFDHRLLYSRTTFNRSDCVPPSNSPITFHGLRPFLLHYDKMSGFEDCCACCFALCCIGGVETMNTWCLFTSCGSGGNGGCCGSCCKRRFDDDSFEQEEAVRFQQGVTIRNPFYQIRTTRWLPNPPRDHRCLRPGADHRERHQTVIILRSCSALKVCTVMTYLASARLLPVSLKSSGLCFGKTRVMFTTCSLRAWLRNSHSTAHRPVAASSRSTRTNSTQSHLSLRVCSSARKMTSRAAAQSFPDPDRPDLFYHLFHAPTPISSSLPVFALSFLPTPPASVMSCSVIGWLPASAAGDQGEAGLNDFVETSALRDEVDDIQANGAIQTQQGWMHIHDSRNLPALGRIGDPMNILASVRVEDGKILAETYQPMPAYRLCTTDGVLQLTEGLAQRLRELLEARVREED